MLLIMRHILVYLIYHELIQLSFQSCPEEYSHNGITVKWNQSPEDFNVVSDPQCYMDDQLITRNCSGDKWTPAADELGPCLKVVTNLSVTSCPPSFHLISESNNEYCYHFDSDNVWDYPCFSSGGATVITDLNEEELNSLIDSLNAVNMSRYFWLPAHRPKLFNPVVWAIPGPNWGVPVEANDYLVYNNYIWKNCLVLDIQQRALTTDSCTQKYPSLCFYINNIHYPAVCPKKGYHAFRYNPDNGTCYGIETSNTGLTYEKFLEGKCKKPMIDNQFYLNRFIFMKIAELNALPNDQWCWFSPVEINLENDNYFSSKSDSANIEGIKGIINNAGDLGLINSSTPLFCMACEEDVIYVETELVFEYNEADNQIYLTVYFPSGLWKYDHDDKGIQCFSDAKGFIKVVNINDLPHLSVTKTNQDTKNHVEKIVYSVSLISQQSAQYWCEGHTFNFSLISTNKLVVNPKGKETHVFALTIRFYNATYEIDDTSRIQAMLDILTNMFNAQKVIWMDVYDINDEFITVLLHLHATVENKHDKEVLNIQETYDNIMEIALGSLSSINCSFVSLKSSIYCLPTTSEDTITLNWGLTPIQHISAPNEFCLQSNGLPVKRQCLGSYLDGGHWGSVEGSCDFNYTPTETTTFLYNVGVGQAPSNDTSSFLTEGLEFALSDVESIIPADIYYLSISLQQILHIAQNNDSCVEMGDIDNIAWVMDRVMEFDCDYLRLSQTLNSTNVILNSVNDIIEIIAKPTSNDPVDSVKVKNYIQVSDDVLKLAVTPQFAVQISYPTFTNITGIAISRVTDSEKFTDMIVQPLYSNSTLKDVLDIDNLEVAAWLPFDLIQSLKPSSNASVDNNTIHVIISVFQNDAVFQELVIKNHLINSRIIGISVPGFISNFEYPLPIVFRQLSSFTNQKYCSFWDFETEKSTMTSGFWKTQGCYPVYSIRNITVCECYHLTHFSQLITIPTSDKYENANVIRHAMALNIITLVGCFLSLMGIVGIWVTALVFSNWRKKAGTKVLLQLSTAIALPSIFIVIFNLDNTIFIYEDGNYVVATHMRPVCIVLGSLLHYSILASFLWMLITAILQFIRYVRVLGVSRPSRFMCKFCLVGWGIPLIPVIVVLSIDVESYIPDSSSIKRICYPKEYYFIVSVLFPICVILFTNVILFLLVLYSISRSSNEKTKSTDFDLVGAQLRLSIFLFFLLGLTWIFGIFSFTNNLLWSYLFCLSSTLQGFVLFIYFIICDPATRNMWITLVKPPFMSNSSRDSITSLG